MPLHNKRAIVILGMHRSGTSAVAGEPLMQAAFDELLGLRAGESPSAQHHLDEIRAASTAWCTERGLALANELLDGHVLRRLPKEVIPGDWLQIVEGLARSV